MSKLFKNKKILIIGHTGFKGSWLSLWLSKYTNNIFGISDKFYKDNSFNTFLKKNVKNHIFDISNFNRLFLTIRNIKPDYIFHLAAQAIVSSSFEDPYKTFITNSVGSLNLLETLKELKIKNCVCVFITSDKCYLNTEKISGYKESDRLGGSDPYSASKAVAELIFKSYYDSFFSNDKKILIASARAGNVIGGNDWTKDRFIPDVIRSIQKNKVLNIRNPNSTRPWQFVLEPLSGYMKLAEMLATNKDFNGESFNFGPIKSKKNKVADLLNKFQIHFKSIKFKYHNELTDVKEANLLSLNIEKSKRMISWSPKLNLDETVKFTSDWYKNFLDKDIDPVKFSLKQIDEYEEIK